MASNKKVVQHLQILLDLLGYEKTNKQLKTTKTNVDKVKNSTVATARAQNEMKRTQEGVHKSSLASSKEFSKQAQGLGGLVRAYATVAANVFALSSAFLVLKRAADFDSMMISANSMTKVMGVNVAGLAKDLQLATGSNLSFAQSLEVTNKALAAGFNASQFSQLGDLVTKISQTFGGSIEANMNKVTQAILRGRTETLSTMGVVIDLEQAYSSYALTLGKTRQELTKFEEQQATLNAFLLEGQKQVGDVAKDPNPYDRMLRNVQDAAQNIMTALSKTLFNPLIGLINDSEDVAFALIATLAAIFAKQLTPDLATYSAAAKKSIASAQVAVNKVRVAQAKHFEVMESQAAKHAPKIKAQARKNVITHMQAELKKRQATIKNQDAIAKYVKTIANTTTAEIKNQTVEVMKSLRAAEAAMTRRINAMKKRGVVDSNPEIKKLIEQRDQISIARGSGTIRNEKAMRAAGRSVKTFSSRLHVLNTTVRANVAIMAQQSAITKANTLALVQEMGVVRGLTAAYSAALIPMRSEITAKTIMITVTRVLTTTMTALKVAINSLIPALTMLWLAWEMGKAILDKLSGSTRKSIKAFREGLKASAEQSEELNKRFSDLDETIAKFEDNRSFHTLAKQLSFVSNALSEASSQVSKLRQSFANLSRIEVDGKMVSVFEERIKKQKELNSLLTEAFSTGFFDNAYKDRVEELKNDIEGLNALTEEAAASVSKVFQQASSRVRFSEEIRIQAGLDPDIVRASIKRSLQSAIDSAAEGTDTSALQTALDDILADVSLEDIKARLDTEDFNGADIERVLTIISIALNDVSNKTMAASRAIQSFGDISLEIRKKLQEGENVYLDKVKLNEEAKLTKNLLNNIKTIRAEGGKSSGDLADILEGDQGEAIRKYFGLDTLEGDLGNLEQKLLDILDTYNNLAKARVKTESDQKLNKLAQQRLDLENKAGVTAQESIKNAVKSAELKQRELGLQAEIIQNDIDLLDIELAKQNLSEDSRTYLELQRTGLEEQLKIQNRQVALINPTLDGLKQQFNILKTALNLEEARVKNQLTILATNEKLASSAEALYRIERKSFEQQKALKAVQLAELGRRLEELNTTRVNRESGQFTVSESAEVAEIAMQLGAMRAEMALMARDAARRETELLARTGDLEANSQTFALAFIKAGEEVARNFESAGARFGEAALNAMDSGFDLIIDNLLSGEGSFKESIKGIARDSIGGILKDNVKSLARTGLAGLFGGKEKSPEEIASSQLEQLTIQTALLSTIAGKNTFDPEVIKELGISLEGSVQGLIQSIINGSGFSAGGDTGNLILSAAFNSIFGMAKGGIVQGGINRYANGTITSGPELAMIGEGRNEEAVVPLPNNREIPVQLSGETGNRIEVNNTFDFRNADVSSERRLRAEAERIKQDTFNTVFSEIGKGGRYAKAVGRR